MIDLQNIPEDLIQSIKERKCALFVGAGLSVNAGYPSWNGLIERLISIGQKRKIFSEEKGTQLIKLLKGGVDPLLLAQELSDEFGRESFLDELSGIFDPDGHEPTVVHSKLPTLPFSLVITTNYDQLIENAYAKYMGKIPRTYTHKDAADFSDALWRDDFFILKAHGDVNRKSSIVLTKKDYREIIYSAPGYKAVMSAIFTTKSILFLGVSLNDPETDMLLSYLHDAFHGSGQYHYSLVPASEGIETIANRWRKDYKVECMTYAASEGHPEVFNFLEELQNRVG